MADTALRQHLEAMEERLFSMIANVQRTSTAAMVEADKLADFATKATEARIDNVDQRQKDLEQRFGELVGAMEAMRHGHRPSQEDERGAGCAQEPARAGRPSSAAVRNWRRVAAGLQPGAVAMSPRSSLSGPPELPASGEHAETSAGRRGRSKCKAHSAEKDAGVDSFANEVMLMVHQMEAMLHAELKVLHKRCNAMQDSLEERALIPLRELEQRFLEQEQTVRQLSSVGQECSSRVEEHEFKLGVTRTKLDMHEQKLALFERTSRWSRRGSDAGEDKAEAISGSWSLSSGARPGSPLKAGGSIFASREHTLLSGHS